MSRTGTASIVARALVVASLSGLIAPHASTAAPHAKKPPSATAKAKKLKAKQRKQLLGFLSGQIGPVEKPAKKGRTPRAAGTALQLVRSYDVPAGDPAYAALANVSWTYDSALAAVAFIGAGDKGDAQTVLDQLAGLQDADGAVGYSYDTQSGRTEAVSKTGSVAMTGLAAAIFRRTWATTRYDALIGGVRRYLTANTLPGGLIAGATGATWASTQHNVLADAFLWQLGATDATARKEEAALAGAIHAQLYVDDGSTAHYRRGTGDDARPIDAQALGVLLELARGDNSSASKLAAGIDANYSVAKRTVVPSSDPATFNPFSANGFYEGFRPYAGAQTPDVMWMEGTAQARLALTLAKVKTQNLDSSMNRWLKITESTSAGPLAADRTVSTPDFGEYHVWPASATGSWMLLGLTSENLVRWT